MVIFVQDDTNISIGALGNIVFAKGYYLYIGSAMGRSGSSTLINRVTRHVSSSSSKSIHWHVDYLLENKIATIFQIILIPSHQKLECFIANELLGLSDGLIRQFGSSDCKCRSHLLHFKNFDYLKQVFSIKKKK